jgi:hypothetical protein
MKVSKTKTHVKIYLTPLEVSALLRLLSEGEALLEDHPGAGHWADSQEFKAANRIINGFGAALRTADEITAGADQPDPPISDSMNAYRAAAGGW